MANIEERTNLITDILSRTPTKYHRRKSGKMSYKHYATTSTNLDKIRDYISQGPLLSYLNKRNCAPEMT